MFNISRKTGEFLEKLVKEHKPKNILEIGTSNGYSTIWLAVAGDEVGAAVTTIETEQEKIDLAKENFKKAGLKNIKIIKGPALEILPKLKQRFDFVFLDAVKSEYIDYLKLLLPKLKKPAIVTAHNIISAREKLKDYLEFVKKFKTKTYKEFDLEVTIF